ncbi:MAG TPA: tryptophan 2,3-dioxygenase family protein [Acidimicrobiales bacterium]|nr:tryptophan 2,3-dioxygenase family protein [Acidimicrobiales bacterium]
MDETNGETTDTTAAVNYSSYLALDEVLGAQRPLSDEHDEMLFIVIHQVYELWFKQLLHEIGHLQGRLDAGDTPHALHTLKRVLTILKVAVAQIDVLETMTPRQFLGFRSRLEASSGFQSAQFRELEAVLGRRDPQVVEHYPAGSAARERIATAMRRPSLFDSFLRYLATQGYDVPSGDIQQVLLRVYQDDGEPAQVAERLVDVDEGVQEWRYRHVKMVERTIGSRPGTGGSPGVAYLRTTLSRPVFPELWDVRSKL